MKLQSNFKAIFKKEELEKIKKEKFERALYIIGSRIVEDTIIKEPRPPIKTGDLRSSYSIEINGKLIEKGNSIDENMVEFSKKDNLLRVSFNTIYAAKWHEKPFKPGRISQQDGGVGNKYLSSKIENYKEDYFKLFADLIKI